MAKTSIEDKLNKASIAPVIEIQFLIEAGNFMLFYFEFNSEYQPQGCKKQSIFQYTYLIYKFSIYD